MKQALKNHITPLVDGLVQATGVQPARKSTTLAKRQARRRLEPVQMQTQKCPRHGDILILFLQASGLLATALCAMHQMLTGPGEHAALADRHHR